MFRSVILFALLVKPILCVFAQNLVVDDINAGKDFYLTRSAENEFTLVYQVKRSKNGPGVYHKLTFDTLLNVNKRYGFQFGRNQRVIATGGNGSLAAVAFYDKILQKIVIDIKKDDAHLSQLFLEVPKGISKKGEARLLPLKDERGFVIMYKVDNHTWQFDALSSKGIFLWRKTFHSKQKLDFPESFVHNNTIILTMRSNFLSRTQENTLIALDPENGNEVFRTSLRSGKSNASIDNVLVVKDNLYISGREFDGRRISQRKIGQPYVKVLDRNLNLSDKLLHPALNSMKLIWMDAVEDKDGRVHLVGETFKSESFAPYLLKAMGTAAATLGMFPVTWCNLKFRELVTIAVDEPRQLPVVTNLPPRKVVYGDHISPYIFANYALRTGQIRYWGNDENGSLYLLSDDSILKRELISTETKTLGMLPQFASRKITLHTTDSTLLVFNYSAINKLEFRIVPLQIAE